jgi:hypothetical protein
MENVIFKEEKDSLRKRGNRSGESGPCIPFGLMVSNASKRNWPGLLPRERSNRPTSSGRHPKSSGKEGKDNDKGLFHPTRHWRTRHFPAVHHYRASKSKSKQRRNKFGDACASC